MVYFITSDWKVHILALPPGIPQDLWDKNLEKGKKDISFCIEQDGRA